MGVDAPARRWRIGRVSCLGRRGANPVSRRVEYGSVPAGDAFSCSA